MTQQCTQQQRLGSFRRDTRLKASLLLLVITTSAFAQAPRNAEAELENIRALPYGFHAQCEDGDLKIRKKGSATFVIRDSLTCVRIRLQIAEQYRHDFTLCSNDPTHENIPTDRKVVKCVSLAIDDDEI